MQCLFPTVICLLICRLERTTDYVTVQTLGAFPQKFKYPTCWSFLKPLDVEYKTPVPCLSNPEFFPQMQTPFELALPENFRQACLRKHSESAPKKRANHKETSCDKTKKRGWNAISRKNKLKAKETRSGIRMRRAHQESIISFSAINHMHWYGAVCSRPCICVQQQEFECSVSCKVGIFEVSSWAKTHVPK